MSGTILDAWRAAPNYHDHEKAFASTRTPGATAYTDPEEADPDSGYYRSLVTRVDWRSAPSPPRARVPARAVPCRCLGRR